MIALTEWVKKKVSEAERFRQRADSLRARATETTDPEVRAELLKIAAEYEAMALTACRDDRGKGR
jgi:hypothetical protein